MKKILLISLIICGLSFISCVNHIVPATEVELIEYYDQLINKTADKIGGGKGYSQIISPENADFVVKNLQELLESLEKASRGEIIYIFDDADINLTESHPLIVPGGVTLASGRGKEGEAARIYSYNQDTVPLIKVAGNGVRITGLIIEGPDIERGISAYYMPFSRGISSEGYDSLEVDNCEIFGWSHAAIYLYNSKKAHIHHNSIHHNQRTGLGYGVNHNDFSNSIVEANLFESNRHAIAGSGHPEQGYIARYNIVLKSSNNYSFDMHGDWENGRSKTNFSGNKILIYENMFNIRTMAIQIHGIPRTGAWIYNNYFPYITDELAIGQRDYFGNLHVFDNNFNKELKAFYVFWSASDSPYLFKKTEDNFSDFAFFDYNGNGTTDIFKADGNKWYIYYYGKEAFKQLRNSPFKIDELDFGDFNGDGIMDVIHFDADGWQISFSAREEWISNYFAKPFDVPISQHVTLGDFNGDQKTDLLVSDGSNWYLSVNANSEWEKFQNSHFTSEQFLVGNFDHDKTNEIMIIDGNNLLIFQTSNLNFKIVNTVQQQLKSKDFLIGDFNGDGISDIISVFDDAWYISWSGTSQWTKLQDNDIDISHLDVGDFNRDGKTDIITISRGLW